jgi:hypothetical protein
MTVVPSHPLHRRFLKRFPAVVVITAVAIVAANLLAADTQQPVPKGDRLLGCAVTEAQDKNYGGAMMQAKAAGIQVVSLKLDWDDVEKQPGVFESPWPKIANGYYPAQGMQVSLRVATLDTNRNRVPADIRDKPFNDPQVIARFNHLLDWVLDEMPDVKLAELSIGNEVDGVLGDDPAKWKQYTEFFDATRKHALEKRPRLKVGVSIMFAGLMKQSRFAAALNEQADEIMVSYYPLTPAFEVRPPQVVRDDFDAICRKYPNRPISFVEAGYPSGSRCGSSPEKQGQFVDQLFGAWDEHPKQIRTVTLVWLHDTSPGAADAFGVYYGVSAPAFRDYLATLGLRTWQGAGADKPAFAALRRQAKARGW